MSDNKKYYYMRLKDNFFNSNEMLVLESMTDGYLYSNILLKLYLLSLKDNGKLMFNDRIPYNSQMIATITRHQVGTVEKALQIFKDMGLIEVLDTGAIYMLDIQQYIGKSSTEADRKKEYRKKIADEQSNTKQLMGQMSGQKSDKRTPEIEIDIEIEKEIELDKDINNVGSNEPSLNERFDKLWAMYPVKQGKKKAFESYKKAIKNGTTDEEIRNGINNYLFYIEKTGTTYIKHGSTWFNQNCWNDDYTVTSKQNTNERAF